MALPPKRSVTVFAEDLAADHLAIVKNVVVEASEVPPTTGQLFGELSKRVRVELDKQLGGRGWNVIVGRSFGAFVTHKIKCYAYVSVFPGVNILMWRS